jgi:hypothetical protein
MPKYTLSLERKIRIGKPTRAKNIHEKVNKKYPGLSKGIYSKSSNGNGEYHQSLNPNISLIEIGGVENTLEESYRTTDVLTDVIAELYRESENNAAPVVAAPPGRKYGEGLSSQGNVLFL